MTPSFSPSTRIPVADEIVHLRPMANAVPRPVRVSTGAAGSCRVKSDGRKHSPLDEGQDMPLFDPLTVAQRIELYTSGCALWVEFPPPGNP